jgi:hypothetical protein
LHLKELGHEPVGPVPKEVQQHLDAASGGDGEQKFYTFRPHRGDIFVLDGLGLGKKEKAMANDNEQLLKTLTWEHRDDNTGGFFEALDKGEGVVYRTWEVSHGARPSQHVLVKHDGVKQTTLGYLAKREEAFRKAELHKEAQQLDLTPNSVAQTAKAEGAGLAAIRAAQHGNNGGRITEGSASASSSASGSVSASTLDKEESTTASHSAGEESTTASHSASSGFPWAKKAEAQQDFMSMSEKCGKCGSSAANCRCGNLGKAELCGKCGKAENLCKCSGMTKSEGATLLAAADRAAHEAALATGRDVLAKSLATGTPELTVHGTDAKGNTQGVAPQQIGERLHNLYVAAKFALDAATKK